MSSLGEIGMGKDFWGQEGFGGERCGACCGSGFITWRHGKERLQERWWSWYMQCLQVMAAEISLASSVGGKAAGSSEGMVAQHFIPISAVASQGEMAAWKWIDGRSDRLTRFVVQRK